MRLSNLTTLIYITRGSECLFIKKTRSGDMNYDKWLGIGGHFETDESPEECAIRELNEETGIESSSISNLEFRGLITFTSNQYETEYMHLFTAEVDASFECPLNACDEGELSWVPLSDIANLPIWEGDKEMFALLFEQHARFFTMKLAYTGQKLTSCDKKVYC